MPEGTFAVFTITIAAPIQKVWDEIVRLNTPQEHYFYMALDSSLEPDSALRYVNPDTDFSVIVGEVLEIIAPRRFVHSFQFQHEGHHTEGKQDVATRVTYELETMAGGNDVKVTITHDRFEEETQTFKDVSGGWPQILNRLKSIIETGHLPPEPEQQ